MKIERGQHIAIVVNSIEPGGGVSNVALAQAKALSQYFSISILCAYGALSHTGINVHRVIEPRLNWLRRFGHVVREYVLCRRFSSALVELNKVKPLSFVLFHSHSAAAMAKPNLGAFLPCGLVVHGDIFTRPKGSYDALLTWFYKHSSRRAYQTIDLLIALSPSMRVKALEYGVESHRVVIIPNGIDVNHTEVREISNTADGVFRLLLIGRLSVEKAPLVLLEALTLLDRSIHLSIAGTGPLEPDVRQFIKSNHLKDRVALLGQLTPTQINDLYLNSDVLCVPSLNDPLPTVILEAMNAGVPVVASEVDGIPFMVKDGVTGILVPPNQPRLLSQAISKLVESAQLRGELARAARKRLNENFSLSAVTEQLVESIEKTIDDRRYSKDR